MELDNEIDILRWTNELEDEVNCNSDRAMVIMVASILDMQLEKLLRRFMVEDKRIDERIFEGNAPLSSFNSKINICYYLGIISEYELKTLNTIRKVRNEFAHKIELKKLSDSSKIIDLCNTLIIPEELYVHGAIKENGMILNFKDFSKISIQSKFLSIFRNIATYLDYRCVEGNTLKRKDYNNLTFSEIIKNSKKELIEQSQELYNLQKKQKELLEMAEAKLEFLNNSDNEETTNIKLELQKINSELEEYEKGNIFHDTILEKLEKRLGL